MTTPLPAPKAVRYMLRCKPCNITKAVTLEGHYITGTVHPTPANLATIASVQVGAFGPPRPWLSHYRSLDNIRGLVCQCGRNVKADAVRAVYKPEVKCNGTCCNAKGFDCQCSCGGKNHGSGW